METRKLESTTGFVLYDLPGADTYVGPARLGAKLQPDNAVMLIRALTYTFAVLEQKKSGATIGLKIDPDQTEIEVMSAAKELSEELQSKKITFNPGLRLQREQILPLLEHDTRNKIGLDDRNGISFEDELTGLGACAAVQAVTGEIEGQSFAIEGFNSAGLGIAREVVSRGGIIKRISTAKGCVTGSFEPDTLADAWMSHGPGCTEQLGNIGKPWDIWKADVDGIFVGSKPGAMAAQGANSLESKVVVGTSPAAISSKALAILRQNDAPAVADFIVNIGPVLSWFSQADTTHDQLRSLTETTISALMADTINHDDGPFLGACYKAESFLKTWQDPMPFGRPLG